MTGCRDAPLDPTIREAAPEGPSGPTGSRPVLGAALAASLAVVAVITLTPRGTGWAWGSPWEEARWYLTGLDSTATVLQLVGNVLLLVAPSALAVLRWPALGRLRLLAGAALATGTGIELLQRLLPLGRVVSPLDAVLNASGALVAGVLVAHVRRMSHPPTARTASGAAPATSQAAPGYPAGRR